MRLMIISEHPDDAQRLGTLLLALGHEPHLAVLHDGASLDMALAGGLRTLQPSVILLDLPYATASAIATVRALLSDAWVRWIPTVLLAGAGKDEIGSWLSVQRETDHHLCVLPFRDAKNALYNLIGVLHGLAPYTASDSDTAFVFSDPPPPPQRSDGAR